LSSYDLWRKTGIYVSQISRIINGRQTPQLRTLEKLAEGLKVDVGELLGYEEKPRPIIEIKADDHFASVPLLADSASLGSGLSIDEAEVMEEPCLIHKRILKKGHTYRAIFVKGDSMIPILGDGDIVAVDVGERDPRKLKKKLVACHTGDFQVSIKQLLIVDQKFYFRAWNKKWEEENAPLITPQKDGLILGKVVWAWKKFE